MGFLQVYLFFSAVIGFAAAFFSALIAILEFYNWSPYYDHYPRYKIIVNEYTRFTQKVRGGLYCDLGLGFRYKVLNLGVGFQHQDFKVVTNETVSMKNYSSVTDTKQYTKVNSFYVKIGLCF
jgi:hypothetical protein